MEMVSTLLELVYPRICVGCGMSMSEEPGHICWNCVAGLSVITPPFCDRCGDPVDGRVDHHYTCAWCQDQAPYFNRCTARSAAVR